MLLELYAPGFTRPAEPEAHDFQRALFLSAAHLQSLPLPGAALAQLLDQQYDQQADYQRRCRRTPPHRAGGRAHRRTDGA